MTGDEQSRLVGLRIREARVAAGLSQGQVAKLMGLHRPTVSEIEAGNRRVRGEELKKMAELFDVTTDFLIGAAPESASLQDARIQLAARELQRLDADAIERVLKVIARVRDRNKGSGG